MGLEYKRAPNIKQGSFNFYYTMFIPIRLHLTQV